MRFSAWVACYQLRRQCDTTVIAQRCYCTGSLDADTKPARSDRRACAYINYHIDIRQGIVFHLYWCCRCKYYCTTCEDSRCTGYRQIVSSVIGSCCCPTAVTVQLYSKHVCVARAV